MAWRKICALCLTVPNLGTPKAPKEGEAIISIQTEIARPMMQVIGLELGKHQPLVAVILPDTRPNLIPPELYEGPLPDKSATRAQSNSIPVQAATAFLEGIGQPDCPHYEDRVFAREYCDPVLEKPLGKLLEHMERKNWYDRFVRQIDHDHALPSYRVFEEPLLLSYLGEQLHTLRTYIRFFATQVDEGEVPDVEPGSDFAFLVILQQTIAIERIWRETAGEKQVEPGGAMLYTYRQKSTGDEDFIYLHRAARHWPPNYPYTIKPVVSGFDPPPLLR